MKQIFTFLPLSILIFSLQANVLEVPQHYSTIQEAIDAAEESDTVLVDVGTYYENISFKGKNIVVTSKYILSKDPSYINVTIIDGSQPEFADTASCVRFVSGESTAAVIQGFTLMRGNGSRVLGGSWVEGGGIVLIRSAATIKHNIIKQNSAVGRSSAQSGGGGGISSIRSDAIVLNNIIMENTAGYASGLVLNWSAGTIRNNIIYANVGSDPNWQTGGLMVWDKASKPAIIDNNTIVANISLKDGGGISVDRDATAYLKNNIVYGNIQRFGDEIKMNNRTYFEYNSTTNPTSGENNISSYPHFTDSAFILASSSPCIDAGKPDTLYFDNEDPENSGFAVSPSQKTLINDMGAYGGPYAMPLPNFELENIYYTEKVIDFKESYINDSLVKAIELKNFGTKKLIIQDAKLVNSTSNLKVITELPDTLYPLEKVVLELQWCPKDSIVLDDTLVINHNYNDVGLIKIPIKGNASSHGIKATYIGSAGFLLETNTKKVIIDGFFHPDGGKEWGFLHPDEEVYHMIDSGMGPYNNFDLILVGHEHRGGKTDDHFYTSTVAKAMVKNPKAILVATPPVAIRLKSQDPDFDSYKNRVFTPALKHLTSIDTVFNGIPLKITNIINEWHDEGIYMFNLTLDSINLLHLMGSSRHDSTYNYSFNDEANDVLLLNSNYINDESHIYRNLLHHKFTLVHHLSRYSRNCQNQLNRISNLRSEGYDINLLRSSMEQYWIKKRGNKLIVDTLNIMPVLQSAIPDSSFTVGEPFTYRLPLNCFKETDKGDKISHYKVEQTSGLSLPDGINFDERTSTFSGTVTSMTFLSIRIRAYDTKYASNSDVFNINFFPATVDINETEQKEIKLYVDHANILRVVSNQSSKNPLTCELYSINGKLLAVTKGYGETISMDVSDFPKGIYVFRMYNKETYFSEKIVIN